MNTKYGSKYSSKLFDFPNEFVNEISNLNSRTTYFHVGLIWIVAFILVGLGRYFFSNQYFWFAYPFLAFLIAGRQGALLQIVHEGSHRLISKSRAMNDFVGDWLAAMPLGLTLEGYTRGHMKHHAGTNTKDDLDTDLEKYSVANIKNPLLYRLFIFDLLGITALRSFLGHNFKSILLRQSATKNEQKGLGLRNIIRLSVCQLVVLGLLFQFDLLAYILFWILPVISFNMFLLRIRGITEHGAPNQMHINIETPDQGNLYTRSVVPQNGNIFYYLLNWTERVLIGSLSANFHHEHHLLPKVPFYNLDRIYAFASKEVVRHNPGVYVDSYFKTLIRTKEYSVEKK